MIRKLLQLAIFLLIVNAAFRVVPAGLRYFEFKDALRELALFSQKASEAGLVDRVMELAEEHAIPLERDYVQVRRVSGQLIINASYLETMKVLPGYDYVRQFDVEARAFNPGH